MSFNVCLFSNALVLVSFLNFVFAWGATIYEPPDFDQKCLWSPAEVLIKPRNCKVIGTFSLTATEQELRFLHVNIYSFNQRAVRMLVNTVFKD